MGEQGENPFTYSVYKRETVTVLQFWYVCGESSRVLVNGVGVGN